MADRILLEARQVSKRFRRRWALLGVDFQIGPGSIVGITGENGSGKSTLLQILAGLIVPTSGVVLRDCRIGLCPQELLVFDSLTVMENLRYFASASLAALEAFKAWPLRRLLPCPTAAFCCLAP
jgi:ABC-2 type transport system ATP-binding protein